MKQTSLFSIGALLDLLGKKFFKFTYLDYEDDFVLAPKLR